MNICAPFIKRPVMTTLVMVSALLFGMMAYTRLPVSDLPNVDFPTILVNAALPGANPETIATAVATPLEREFSTISGLDSMSSTSSLGSIQITLQFDLRRDIDAAAQDVQAAISRAANQLPEGMPNPPSYRKVNPADQPILYLALTSPTLPLYTLNDYGQTVMAQRISMVSGVAQVLVYGSQKYAVRIQLDPKALAFRDIGIDQVADAVRRANVNLPTGALYGKNRAFTVQATGQLTSAKPYRSIIIAYRGGKPVQFYYQVVLAARFDFKDNSGSRGFKTGGAYVDKRLSGRNDAPKPAVGAGKNGPASRNVIAAYRKDSVRYRLPRSVVNYQPRKDRFPFYQPYFEVDGSTGQQFYISRVVRQIPDVDNLDPAGPGFSPQR